MITGGSGFFGSILTRYLLERGHTCVNIDLVKTGIPKQPNYFSYHGDIRSMNALERVF